MHVDLDARVVSVYRDRVAAIAMKPPASHGTGAVTPQRMTLQLHTAVPRARPSALLPTNLHPHAPTQARTTSQSALPTAPTRPAPSPLSLSPAPSCRQRPPWSARQWQTSSWNWARRPAPAAARGSGLVFKAGELMAALGCRVGATACFFGGRCPWKGRPRGAAGAKYATTDAEREPLDCLVTPTEPLHGPGPACARLRRQSPAPCLELAPRPGQGHFQLFHLH